jgi:hypothetical protein
MIFLVSMQLVAALAGQKLGQVQISAILSGCAVLGCFLEIICLQLIEYQRHCSGGF